MTQRVEGTTNPAIRVSEVVSSKEYVVTEGSQQIEGKPLVLLQASSRGILSKILEFWNLVDILDVITGTESWLREEINNVEVFRDDYTTFKRERCIRGYGVFIHSFIHSYDRFKASSKTIPPHSAI
jgi:hypothetical protein